MDKVIFESVVGDRASAEERLQTMKKKNPSANYSVIQGRASGKWHVVHHTSGGMRMVENTTITFEDFLTEDAARAEYHPVLKSHGFKNQPGGVSQHTEHGVVKINKHGHWTHTHPSQGSFEGSTGHSLNKHLSGFKPNL